MKRAMHHQKKELHLPTVLHNICSTFYFLEQMQQVLLQKITAGRLTTHMILLYSFYIHDYNSSPRPVVSVDVTNT